MDNKYVNKRVEFFKHQRMSASKINNIECVIFSKFIYNQLKNTYFRPLRAYTE